MTKRKIKKPQRFSSATSQYQLKNKPKQTKIKVKKNVK